jgi:hypothetical protein
MKPNFNLTMQDHGGTITILVYQNSYFFFWPLCGLFFFDIWILIAPLVSSNSSYLSTALSTCTYNKFECFVFLLIIPRLVSEHVPSYTVKVLLFIGTKFHGSNITGIYINGKILFRWIFILEKVQKNKQRSTKHTYK